MAHRIGLHRVADLGLDRFALRRLALDVDDRQRAMRRILPDLDADTGRLEGSAPVLDRLTNERRQIQSFENGWQFINPAVRGVGGRQFLSHAPIKQGGRAKSNGTFWIRGCPKHINRPELPRRAAENAEPKRISSSLLRASAPPRESPPLDHITGSVIDTALQIHKDLGPGLLESVYESVLAKALERRGLRVERQKSITFKYDDMTFDDGFRVDLLVEGWVVVELKSVEILAPVHSKQLLTYLRLLNLPVGLLINFGAATLKEGLHRIVNHLPPSASPRLRVNQPPPG